MTKFLDNLMRYAYRSTLSIMDVFIIMVLGELGSRFSMWIWLLLLPWCIYSAKQENLKYDEQ